MVTRNYDKLTNKNLDPYQIVLKCPYKDGFQVTTSFDKNRKDSLHRGSWLLHMNDTGKHYIVRRNYGFSFSTPDDKKFHIFKLKEDIDLQPINPDMVYIQDILIEADIEVTSPSYEVSGRTVYYSPNYVNIACDFVGKHNDEYPTFRNIVTVALTPQNTTSYTPFFCSGEFRKTYVPQLAFDRIQLIFDWDLYQHSRFKHVYYDLQYVWGRK